MTSIFCKAEDDPSENAAGPWGDYRNCDTPWNAIEDMFLHISKTHKVNFCLIYASSQIKVKLNLSGH